MTDIIRLQPSMHTTPSQLSQLVQLCVTNASSATPANSNSEFKQAPLGQEGIGQAARREQHAANSGGSSEPTKSKSGSDDEDCRGLESNVRASRLEQHGAGEPNYSRSTNNARSGSDSGNSNRAAKVRKTSHTGSERATNSSEHTKSGSGDDDCGSNGSVAAALTKSDLCNDTSGLSAVQQNMIKITSGTKSIDVDWVTLQKVVLRLFTEGEQADLKVNTGLAATPSSDQPAARSPCTGFKADRPCNGDGYKWRKYGRKFLTFSRLNRDYYRCTYRGCASKKHVEVVPETGEIVTSGSTPHSHEPFAHLSVKSSKSAAPSKDWSRKAATPVATEVPAPT